MHSGAPQKSAWQSFSFFPLSFKDLDLGDPRFQIDFRDVYATVLRRWLQVDPAPILGERADSLALF